MSREIRPVLKPQIAPRDRRDRCQENEEGERDQCCNVSRDKKPVIWITHVNYVCVRGAHPSKTATDGAALQVPARLRELRLSNAKRAPTSIIVTNKSAGMVKSYPAIIRVKMGNRAVAKITVTTETKPDLKPAPAKLVPKVIIVGARTQIPRSTEVARGCLPSPWWRATTRTIA